MIKEEVSASKNDIKDGKIGYEFLHPAFLYQVGAVFEAGAIKYDKWNYLKGHKASQLLNACKRHLDLWFYSKEEYDKDCSDIMGMPISHLANAAACLNMALAQIAEGTIKDDRPERSLKFGVVRSWFLTLFDFKKDK